MGDFMLSRRVIFAVAFAAVLAAPLAFAQQPPSPQQCSAAINAVVAQRNQAMDGAANVAAQLTLMSSDNEALKKQVLDLQKQVADLSKPKDETKP
jgi:septal ring factor EnvC (AmiA/AmiB activator)